MRVEKIPKIVLTSEDTKLLTEARELLNNIQYEVYNKTGITINTYEKLFDIFEGCTEEVWDVLVEGWD